MVEITFYKDRPAVAIACEEFTAVFLPEDGAKLVSFKTREEQELMAQASNETYLRLGLDSNYVECECSAFDDMFPTIDPCVINGMEYMDHGEVCRRAHIFEVVDNVAVFRCELKKLNISYNKAAFSQDGALYIRYCITNHNKFDFPFIWAGHMMFRGENGAYVVSKYSSEDAIEVMFGSPGTSDKAHILGAYGSGKEYKYYYTEAKAPVKCGIVYPESNLQLFVEFDNDIVRYLGVWMNPGDLKEMYNLALEPATALFDDPLSAEEANAASYIGAGETIEFTLRMEYRKVD